MNCGRAHSLFMVYGTRADDQKVMADTIAR